MFENRKAKKLGLRDIGVTIEKGMKIHQKCGKRLRIGETPENKSLAYCPSCLEIVGETLCPGF